MSPLLSAATRFSRQIATGSFSTRVRRQAVLPANRRFDLRRVDLEQHQIGPAPEPDVGRQVHRAEVGTVDEPDFVE